MDNNKSVDFKTTLLITGAFISYMVGAGFASGNEVMQFFGSWGLSGAIIGILGSMIVTMIYCKALFTASQFVTFEKTTDSYTYFGGEGFGRFFKVYVLVSIVATFMIMFSGAGSLLNQIWGLPQWVGAILLGTLSGVVVLGGLKTVENVLGSAGILILVYVVILGIVSIFNPESSFEQSAGLADAVAQGQVLQTNIFALPPFSFIPKLENINSSLIEGMLYGTLNLVAGFPFILTLGYKNKNKKEVNLSSIFTPIGFYLCISVMVLILLSNFNSIVNPSTGQMYPFPVLAIVDSFWPSGSWTYVIIIFTGIFTTVSGYLWVLKDSFFPGDKEDSKQSKFFVAGLILLGIALGGVLPFSQLVNLIYPISGFVGLIMLVILFVKYIKGFNKYEKESTVSEAGSLINE